MFNENIYRNHHFKNHIATHTYLGNIQIIDFEKPGQKEHRVRFLFEEDHYKLHISGDFGNLTATNESNMTLKGFRQFVNNISYFTEKIDCHDRPLYNYDVDKAVNDITNEFNSRHIENPPYDFNEFLMDCTEDFDTERGIGPKGYERLDDEIGDAFEFVSYLGRENTDILDIYMLAFKMAVEQLAEKDKTGLFTELNKAIKKE